MNKFYFKEINKIDFDFFFAYGGLASSTVKADTILYKGELLSLTKGFAAPNNNWSNLKINDLYLVKSNIKIAEVPILDKKKGVT